MIYCKGSRGQSHARIGRTIGRPILFLCYELPTIITHQLLVAVTCTVYTIMVLFVVLRRA